MTGMPVTRLPTCRLAPEIRRPHAGVGETDSRVGLGTCDASTESTAARTACEHRARWASTCAAEVAAIALYQLRRCAANWVVTAQILSVRSNLSYTTTFALPDAESVPETSRKRAKSAICGRKLRRIDRRTPTICAATTQRSGSLASTSVTTCCHGMIYPRAYRSVSLTSSTGCARILVVFRHATAP
jgi:hypothetical protein